jgi:hypothetical protein
MEAVPDAMNGITITAKKIIMELPPMQIAAVATVTQILTINRVRD